MNLKKLNKVADSKKSAPYGVKKLYNIIDAVVKRPESDVDSEAVAEFDDPSKERAARVEEYSNNLVLLLNDEVTSAQDIIQTFDEIVSDEPEIKSRVESRLSEEFDVAESLDDTIWDYVKHMELDPNKVVEIINNTEDIPEEIFVILVDEILGNE